MSRIIAVGLMGLLVALLGARVVIPSDSAHADPNAPLQIAATLPADAIAGQGGFIMKVYGDGFPADVDASDLVSINWNGTSLPATIKSSTEVHVFVPDELIASPGQANLGVTLWSGQSAPMSGAFNVWKSSSDTNCDGIVGSRDALYVMRVLAQLTTESSRCSIDANNDGEKDLSDVNWVRLSIAGLVEPLKAARQN